MTTLRLKQYVPSSVCLKCDGCCRFDRPDSMWRPTWDRADAIDEKGFVTTVQAHGRHLCRFFNPSDSTCGVYGTRPVECALYPFVLSARGRDIDVQLHLACPFVQDTHPSAALEAHIAYLRELFALPGTRDYLRAHKRLWRDYAPASIELLHLFTLDNVLP